MRLTVAASLLAVILPLQPILAQGAPAAGEPAPSMTQDSAEEIAKDAARDLNDNRLYNKPGATRAQYDADWQECRLIARGSLTPSRSVPYFYNPAVISPLAAGIGAGIGGLIGNAIVQGQQRRANRRACLLIKGWRLVELPKDESARVAAMTDDQRSAYFDTVVGAKEVRGGITERTSFTHVPDPALPLDAPVALPGSVFLGKKVDPSAPLQLGPDEAAIVIAYRRPDAASAGRSGAVQLARYDPAGRDLVYRPRDWKKKGDKTTYGVLAASADRKAAFEVQVLRVTAGDYVIAGTSVGPGNLMAASNCFGAPTIHVEPGEVAYVGDFIPFMNAKLSSGAHVSLLAYASHIEDARSTLTTKQPALAAAMKPAAMRNRATFACSAMIMDRWDLPGLEPLGEPASAAPTVAAEPAPEAATPTG